MILRRLGLLLTCMFLIGSLNAQDDLCLDLTKPYLTPEMQNQFTKNLIGFVIESDRSVFEFDKYIWFLPNIFYPVAREDTMIKPPPCPPCQDIYIDFIKKSEGPFRSHTTYHSDPLNHSFEVTLEVMEIDTVQPDLIVCGPCCMCKFVRPFIEELLGKFSHFFGEMPDLPYEPKKVELLNNYEFTHDIIGKFSIESKITFNYSIKHLIYQTTFTQIIIE